jgi:hypothetical protein
VLDMRGVQGSYPRLVQDGPERVRRHRSGKADPSPRSARLSLVVLRVDRESETVRVPSAIPTRRVVCQIRTSRLE